jgi:hypothetical protein
VKHQQSRTVAALLVVCICAPTAKAARLHGIDLQKVLCGLSSQQPNNVPSAGVDFVSENELLIYTVCRGEAVLTRRDESWLAGADHLKAVILDLATGAVKQRFDWPVHDRGATVRVTHASELLVQRGNLLQLMTTEGKPKTSLRIVKVSPSDRTLVNLSSAVDPIVVVESSEVPGEKTVNGVAILNSRNLEVLADFHDNGESWNIAASSKAVVRTSDGGSRLQLKEFSSGKLGETWKTIWLGTKGDSRPVFLNDESLTYAIANVVLLFKATGKATERIECNHAVGVRVARDGNALGAICPKVGGQNPRVGVGRLGETLVNEIEVYRLSPFGPRGTVPIDSNPDPGFDFALSPDGSKVAVIDRLHLKVVELP